MNNFMFLVGSLVTIGCILGFAFGVIKGLGSRSSNAKGSLPIIHGTQYWTQTDIRTPDSDLPDLQPITKHEHPDYGEMRDTFFVLPKRSDTEEEPNEKSD